MSKTIKAIRLPGYPGLGDQVIRFKRISDYQNTRWRIQISDGQIKAGVEKYRVLIKYL